MPKFFSELPIKPLAHGQLISLLGCCSAQTTPEGKASEKRKTRNTPSRQYCNFTLSMCAMALTCILSATRPNSWQKALRSMRLSRSFSGAFGQNEVVENFSTEHFVWKSTLCRKEGTNAASSLTKAGLGFDVVQQHRTDDLLNQLFPFHMNLPVLSDRNLDVLQVVDKASDIEDIVPVVAMNRNGRRPKKANKGSRPCSRAGRRAKKERYGKRSRR